MTDRHLRTAFLDLVDGRGIPHPEHRPHNCAGCRQAAELRSLFERDLETGVQELAPQALPPGMLSLPTTAMSLGWFPLFASVTAALLVIGVAVAAPSIIPVGMGTSPGIPSPRTSPAPTPHPAIDAHRRTASEAQQPYFADGVIDADEYRAAVEATVACMRAEGFQFRAYVADDDYYQYTGPAGPGLSEALDTCREEHSQEVELAYQEITGPTEDEMPAVRVVTACLREAGHPPTSGYRPDQLREFIEALPLDEPARRCGQSLPGSSLRVPTPSGPTVEEQTAQVIEGLEEAYGTDPQADWWAAMNRENGTLDVTVGEDGRITVGALLSNDADGIAVAAAMCAAIAALADDENGNSIGLHHVIIFANAVDALAECDVPELNN